MKSNLIAVLGGVVTIFFASSVMAQPLRDASNSVYLYNLTAGSSHEYTVSGTPPLSRKVKANHCGVAKAAFTPGYATATIVSLGSLQSNISALPVAIPGTCKKNKNSETYALVDSPAAARFKNSENTIYFQGLTPLSEQVIAYRELFKIRKATANACGYIKMSSKETSPITATSVIAFNNDLEFTVGSLRVVFPPKCQKISETQSAMVISVADAALWAVGD
jgi:hypothetical protein